MFNWYRAAKICFAYLCDLPENDQVDAPYSAFRQSQWFTRGWTLQELLAPTDVVFVSKGWKSFLGTRFDLLTTICEITGIDYALLDGFDTFYEQKYSAACKAPCSIAKIMSWAATRETTRLEDTSYCLLGLFGVQMPLLYGEMERLSEASNPTHRRL